MKRKFIYQDQGTHLFWDIEVNQNGLTVHFGNYMTYGQTESKAYPSTADSNKAAEALIAEKIQEGYLEVGADGRHPFLAKHDFRRVSYDELLKLLKVKKLWTHWDAGDGSESDYYSRRTEIYYHAGDLQVSGDLMDPGVDLLVVHGNLDVAGAVDDRYGDAKRYYVTGDASMDYLTLGAFQHTGGTETVRYVAVAWGEDDEVLHQLPARKINAPFFFSWFYDLKCFKFAPQTVITAMYDQQELAAYKTTNAFLPWHDYAFAFRDEFYHIQRSADYNMLDLTPRDFYIALKNNQPVWREGVTPEGIKLYQQGVKHAADGDVILAYQHYKKAIEQAPGFFLPYNQAGDCLFYAKGYQQASVMYEKAVQLAPPKVVYDLGCRGQAAITALILGDRKAAEAIAKAAIDKVDNDWFAMRVLAEVKMQEGKLDKAITLLKNSLKICNAFTSNWLMGLAYYLKGETDTAKRIYNTAQLHSTEAKPYEEHTSLHYFYGDNVTLDWDTKKTVKREKDQAYYDEVYAKNTHLFYADRINPIPREFRTRVMLEDQLKNQHFPGFLIELFDAAVYTPEIMLSAVKRPQPAPYSHIPDAFITVELLESHPYGIDVERYPKELLTYDVFFRAVCKSERFYMNVPLAFRDERMNIALIAGGALNSGYVKNELPRKYATNEYILQAIDLGMDVITRIRGELVSKEVYDYATAKYGQEPGWSSIVNERKPGPAFESNTFEKVWACFWDEEFMIKALTFTDPKASERILGVPAQYLTQRICDIAVERNFYDFAYVPSHFITPAMCDKALGGMFEYVPLSMRTQSRCEIAVKAVPDNIAYVPIAFRDPGMFAEVLTRRPDFGKYIPHDKYAATYAFLFYNYQDRFEQYYLLLHWGIGLIIDGQYATAREKLQQVTDLDDDTHQHQAKYYMGWSYFLEGNTAKANEYLKIAKAHKEVSKEHKLDEPYASFQLPEVREAYEMSPQVINEQMRQVSMLISCKDYKGVSDILANLEQLLTAAGSTELRLWSYIWDYQRYVWYEAGRKEEALALCARTVERLSNVMLWDYLSEYNPIRHALRSAHNSLAYRCYETATDLKGVLEGLEHIKITMKTISPIEGKQVLNYFYETQALLYYKAMGFDAKYQQEFDKVITKINKLKLKEAGVLSTALLNILN